MSWGQGSSTGPRRLLRVHGPWVLTVTAVVMLVAWLYSSVQPPVYVSTSEVVVETKVFANTTPVPPNMATERQLVISGIVLTTAAEQAGLDPGTMLKSSSVTVPADTSFLDITCTAGQAERARACAAALAQAYVAYRNAAANAQPGKSTSPGAGAKAQALAQVPVDAVLVSPAYLPDKPSGTPRLLLLGIAFGAGLALGVATAFLRDRFDDRIRDRDDAERRLAAPVAAGVPRVRSGTLAQLITQAPQSTAAAALRHLRVRVEAALPGRPSVVLVVGVAPGDGSSTVASNLAQGLALAGHRTILVDADITRVGVEALYGLGERTGLVDLLTGTATVSQALLDSPLPGLQLLTAGSRAHRREDLLEADRLRATLDQVRDRADLVVIDGAALTATSTPLVLAMVSDLVLMVLDARGTTRTRAEQAACELRAVGVQNLLGVLNRVHPGDLPRMREPSTLIPRSAEALPESWQQPLALPTDHAGALVARHAGGPSAPSSITRAEPVTGHADPADQADEAGQADHADHATVQSPPSEPVTGEQALLIDLAELEHHRLIVLTEPIREPQHNNGTGHGGPPSARFTDD